MPVRQISSRVSAALTQRTRWRSLVRPIELEIAGADKAKLLVLAIDDVEQSVEVAKMARQNFPRMAIVARARNVQHYYELHELGVTMIERETLDSALMSARSALSVLSATNTKRALRSVR